eukprot:20266-Eustigmatos_ZCMA.PRE.1
MLRACRHVLVYTATNPLRLLRGFVPSPSPINVRADTHTPSKPDHHTGTHMPGYLSHPVQ